MIDRKNILVASLMAVSAILVSCSKSVDPVENEGLGTISVNVAPMTIASEQVPWAASSDFANVGPYSLSMQPFSSVGTRAVDPMDPLYENQIFDITVLVFDSEGTLLDFEDTGLPYRFINYKTAAGDGQLTITLSTEGFPILENRERSYDICLIANLESRALLDDIVYTTDANGRRVKVDFNGFKEKTVEILYYTGGTREDRSLEIGDVELVTMFGYFEGVIPKEKRNLTITLGRLISRLEILISLPDGFVQEGDKALYMAMTNLELMAHIFPSGISPGIRWSETMPQRLSESVLNHIYYFYAGPNSAETPGEATSLRLWYRSASEMNRLIASGNLPDPDATVALCNDSPSAANRNYQLNRNSVYSFNINLTYK